jgi:hypothetical protein
MTILAYAACFLALATLAGLAAASGRRWQLRLPLLVATPILALAVWWQLAQRDGWPTGSPPADGSTFVAGVVEAPTPGSPGAIYLWAQPPNSNAPRAYRLPYTQQLEKDVANAAKAAKRGTRVGVRATKARATKRRGGKRRTRAQVRPAALEFYRVTENTAPSPLMTASPASAATATDRNVKPFEFIMAPRSGAGLQTAR